MKTYRRAIADGKALKMSLEFGTATLLVRESEPIRLCYERVPIQINDASRPQTFCLEVFVGEVNNVLKDDGRVRTDIDLRLIRWIGGVGDLLLQFPERVDIRAPHALVFVVVEKAH